MKTEATICIFNTICVGTKEHFEFLEEKRAMVILLENLSTADANLITNTLKTFKIFLIKESNFGIPPEKRVIRSLNVPIITSFLEECCSNPIENISMTAEKILEIFFNSQKELKGEPSSPEI